MPPGLLPLLVVLAGLFGAVIGSFLNVVVHRVPAGIALTRESRCPHCDDAVRPWQNVPVLGWIALRGRCAACSEAISPRYPLVEAGTGLAFAGITWLGLAHWPDAGGPSTGSGTGAGSGIGAWALVVVLIAYLYFAAISIVLTLIDLDTRRLPNAIVLPGYIVSISLFTLACVLGADWGALLRAGIGMASLYGFYLLLSVIRPGGMGGGDIKLAGVVGLYLGWLGWGPLIVGAFAAFLVGGVFGLALILGRRATRKTAIPFGPWLLAGAWIGILFGEAIAHAYTGLIT